MHSDIPFDSLISVKSWLSVISFKRFRCSQKYVVEPPITEQIDRFEQVEFLPRVIQNLSFIRHTLDYDFIIVSNQDGLGTKDYPRKRFEAINKLIFSVFHTEGVDFDEFYFDEHTPDDFHPNRKPGTGMLTKFIEGNGTEYDLAHSYVIGDRISDIQLARNLGCQGILLAQNGTPDECREWLQEHQLGLPGGKDSHCALIAESWDDVAAFLFAGERRASLSRVTKETDIQISLDLDGTGRCDISTGLGFFDHMLEQIGPSRPSATSAASAATASASPWTIASARSPSTSAAAPGSSGMPSSIARRSATCPPRCSSTSSSRSPTPPAST